LIIYEVSFFFVLELIICKLLSKFFFTVILLSMSNGDKNKINDDFKAFSTLFLADA